MEQLDLILQKLGAAVLWQKVAGLVGLVVLITGGYFYLLLDDVLTQREQMVVAQKKLVQEKGEYEERKKEYLAFKAEVEKLQEDQIGLLKILPKSDDIEQFVETIQQQIELAGLTRVTLIRGIAQQRELHLRLPIKISVIGAYHQVMRFIKSMGEIQRVVNIEELNLTLAPGQNQVENRDLLKAEFIAVAFQYSTKSGPKPKGTPGATGLKPAATAGGGK